MISATRRLVLGDASAASVSSLVRSVGRMITVILVARSAGLTGFGAFTVMVAAEMIAVSAVNALLASPPSVLAPGRYRRLRATIYRQAEGMQHVVGWLLGLVALVAITFEAVSLSCGVMFASYLVVGSIYQARRSTHITDFRSRRVLLAELMIVLVGVSALLAGGLMDWPAATTFWAGQCVAHGMALFIVQPARCAASTPRRSKIIRAALLRTGWKMLAGSLAISLSGRSQPMIIGVMLGAPATALYGGANTIAAPVRMASGSLRAALLPRLAKRARGSRHIPLRWMAAFVLASLLLAWAAHAVSPILLRTLFGSDFEEAAPLVSFALLQAMLAAGASVVATKLQAQHRSGQCASIRWIVTLLSPFVLVIGVRAAGLSGLMIASILVECLALVLLIALDRQGKPDSNKREAGLAPACGLA